jgi:hypothetical protein
LQALEPLADFVRLCEGERTYVTIAVTPILYARVLRAAAASEEDLPVVKAAKT